MNYPNPNLPKGMQKEMILPHDNKPTISIVLGGIAYALAQFDPTSNIHLLTEIGGFLSMCVGLGVGLYRIREIYLKRVRRRDSFEKRLAQSEAKNAALEQRISDLIEEKNDALDRLYHKNEAG